MMMIVLTSTMATVQVNLVVSSLLLYVCSPLTVGAEQECANVLCPGPLAFYRELSCTPVFKAPGDCCAVKYNCDYLDNQSPDKCHFNGYEYNISESLRKEDERCFMPCKCVRTAEGDATFRCGNVEYIFPVDAGCYRRQNATDCRPGPQICPKTPEERPKCTVDGREYLDGEIFSPQSEPDKICYCGPGYAGENVEPFCKVYANDYPKCDLYLRHNAEVRRRCAPIYQDWIPPHTGCNLYFRCQSDTDEIINHGTSGLNAEGSVCLYGNLTMNVGDELNVPANISFRKLCTKCVCEVPPVPTCRRLADNSC